eukprot:7512104-Lingulodinium_polyedra.AAC.1
MHADLEQQGLLMDAPTGASNLADPTDWLLPGPLPRSPLATVTYVDDLTAFATDADPDALLGKAKALAAAVHRALTNHGLRPNYSQGKTELLLDLRGKGSKGAKRTLFVDYDGKLLCGDGIQVVACRSYRHFGGIVCTSNQATPEIAHRVKEHNAARALVGRAIGNCNQLPQGARGTYYN